MALPSSGAITLAMLQAEFGGSSPVSLSSYYRGGGLVPNSAQNAAIPTSGSISLSQFYGTAALTPFNFSLTASGDGLGNWGYRKAAWGALSPAVITAGIEITSILDIAGGGGGVSITGFASDPGKNYFDSITLNGVTQTSTSATYSYSLSTKVATWSWTSKFGFVNLTTYPGVLMLR